MYNCLSIHETVQLIAMHATHTVSGVGTVAAVAALAATLLGREFNIHDLQAIS